MKKIFLIYGLIFICVFVFAQTPFLYSIYISIIYKLQENERNISSREILKSLNKFLSKNRAINLQSDITFRIGIISFYVELSKKETNLNNPFYEKFKGNQGE